MLAALTLWAPSTALAVTEVPIELPAAFYPHCLKGSIPSQPIFSSATAQEVDLAMLTAFVGEQCAESAAGVHSASESAFLVQDEGIKEETRRTRESSEVVAARVLKLEEKVVTSNAELKAIRVELEGPLSVSGVTGGTSSEVSLTSVTIGALETSEYKVMIYLVGVSMGLLVVALIYRLVRTRS